jgi:hypothetical protein
MGADGQQGGGDRRRAVARPAVCRRLGAGVARRRAAHARWKPGWCRGDGTQLAVLAGTAEGRRPTTEITAFDSTGLKIQGSRDRARPRWSGPRARPLPRRSRRNPPTCKGFATVCRQATRVVRFGTLEGMTVIPLLVVAPWVAAILAPSRASGQNVPTPARHCPRRPRAAAPSARARRSAPGRTARLRRLVAEDRAATRSPHKSPAISVP